VPTYEYKCNKCEEAFEYFQKMSEDPLRECPVCGGELKRLISGGAGIIFKGKGFYTTDYKNSSHTLSSSTSNSSTTETKKEGEKKEGDNKETIKSENK